MSSVAPGILFFVVGASGVGKDTLMARARTLLGGDGRFRFARRTITRPADPDGENHHAGTQSAFLAARARQ
ncbi:MAG TPA: phosphonate metabolism protein/1,5-bisphosphokinase (PRPP-forming) PhnN, partial [Burkholderiaceae bacterium]